MGVFSSNYLFYFLFWGTNAWPGLPCKPSLQVKFLFFSKCVCFFDRAFWAERTKCTMPQKSNHNMTFLELQEFHLIIWNGTYRTNKEWRDKAKNGESKKLYWHTVKKCAPFLSAPRFLRWSPRTLHFQGLFSSSTCEIFNFVFSFPWQCKYKEHSHILDHLDYLHLT